MVCPRCGAYGAYVGLCHTNISTICSGFVFHTILNLAVLDLCLDFFVFLSTLVVSGGHVDYGKDISVSLNVNQKQSEVLHCNTVYPNAATT